MQVFPAMMLKQLADCKDGELVLTSNQEVAFISSSPDKLKKIIVLPEHSVVSGSVVSALHEKLVSLGVDYEVEVDPTSFLYPQTEFPDGSPGWLQLTGDGLAMLYTSSFGGLCYELEGGFSFPASHEKYGLAKCFFTKWSIFITYNDKKQRKMLFQFDATVK